MHIRKDNTSSWWRSANQALLLLVVFLPVTLISCFSPRINPLDPENPNAAKGFGVTLDYKSRITGNGSENLLFTASVETEDPLYSVWRITRNGQTGVDTTESLTYTQDIPNGWISLEVELEVISERGARGRDTSVVPPLWCRYEYPDRFPAQKELMCMALDSSGMIWLGGRMGLWRFDGASFQEERPYPQSTDSYFGSVFSILVTKSGTKYLGSKPEGDLYGGRDTVGGGLWYDWSGGWQNESPPISRVEIGRVSDLVIDSRNNLWILTDSPDYRTGRGASHLLLKEEGSTVYAEVSLDSAFSAQTGFDGIPISDLNVGLATDDASVWFGGQQETGLLNFDLETRRWHQQLIRGDQVRNLTLASGGGVWAGTSDRGLHLVQSLESGIALSFREESSAIPSDAITALASSGNRPDIVWIGTDKGLARLDGEILEAVPIVDGGLHEQPEIRSLLIDERRGVLWIGTPIGLFCHRFK